MDTLQHKIMTDLIDWLVAISPERPSLEAIAQKSGYDTAHIQKLFTQHTGLSPKRFMDVLTHRTARDFLLKECPTLETAYNAGLSGQGRLHDLFVRVEAATPGETSKRGQNLSITYGWHPTILGEMMVATTPRGVCWLGFRVNESRALSQERLKNYWPLAKLIEDDGATASAASDIIALWSGKLQKDKPLALDIYGTNLQIQVWKALMRIPMGHTMSYSDIAAELGKPKASRAVGNAVGANPISLIIPCHRVIRKSGVIDNYGWGSPRKKALLGLENSINAR